MERVGVVTGLGEVEAGCMAAAAVAEATGEMTEVVVAKAAGVEASSLIRSSVDGLNLDKH